MYSINKYCKNSRTLNNNFRIVYTDFFKCPTFFAAINLLKMTYNHGGMIIGGLIRKLRYNKPPEDDL